MPICCWGARIKQPETGRLFVEKAREFALPELEQTQRGRCL